MKILTVIGARPQFIKAAALWRAAAKRPAGEVKDVWVHTGQHYDANMSAVFFEELSLPYPKYNLRVGSGLHGDTTGRMMAGIEQAILQEKPDYVLVYGDTNSTLAGALAAAKTGIPVVHVEAGLRSFNRTMPEEINRVLTDHCASFLFTPTEAGLRNLQREGLADSPMCRCFHCGDVMMDNALYYGEWPDAVCPPDGFSGGDYILATIHRNTNTDVADRLLAIFGALRDLAHKAGIPIILPLHPRTGKMMRDLLPKSFLQDLYEDHGMKIIDPVGYLEMLRLEKHAGLVVTDSGGVQKEAYFFKRPCLVLRAETEWVEIVENGCARLVDAQYHDIMRGASELWKTPGNFPPIFGSGHAAEFILTTLSAHFADRVRP